MALHAANVVMFQNSGVRHRILANRGRARDHRRIKAMREIQKRLVARAFEKSRRPESLHLIPPHVRDPHAPLKAADTARKNAEAAFLRSFLAGHKQRLQAKTNS